MALLLFVWDLESFKPRGSLNEGHEELKKVTIVRFFVPPSLGPECENNVLWRPLTSLIKFLIIPIFGSGYWTPMKYSSAGSRRLEARSALNKIFIIFVASADADVALRQRRAGAAGHYGLGKWGGIRRQRSPPIRMLIQMLVMCVWGRGEGNPPRLLPHGNFRSEEWQVCDKISDAVQLVSIIPGVKPMTEVLSRGSGRVRVAKEAYQLRSERLLRSPAALGSITRFPQI